MSTGTVTSRDRFLDVIRALGMVAVVFNHYAYTLLFADESGRATLGMLQERGHAWVTWPFAWEMPAFFLPAAALSYASSARTPWRPFVTRRLWRLLLPVVPFAAALVIMQMAQRAAGVEPCRTWNSVPATCAVAMPMSPLWFLVVLIPLTALTPALARLWRSRWRTAGLAGVVALATLSDLIRHVGGTGLGINDISVWLFIWFLGFAYADGSLRRISRRTWITIAGVGAVAMAALMQVGPYEQYLYASPRSLMTVIECTVGTAALMALRPVLAAVGSRPRTGAAVDWIGRNMMGIFLWHYVAFSLAITAVFALGVRHVDGLELGYLGQRLAVIVMALPLLTAFLALARRVDAIPFPSQRRLLQGVRAGATETAEP